MPWPWLLAGALLVVFLAGPLLALAGRVPRTPLVMFKARDLRDALRFTVLSATASVWIVAFVGVPLGVWMARTRSRLRHVATVAAIVPLAVPPVVAGIILLLWLVVRRDGMGWLGFTTLSLPVRIANTALGSVLTQIYIAAPFVVLAARTAVAGVDPAFEDAARCLGLGPNRTLQKVILPLARRGIMLGLVLGWVRCLGEFGALNLVAPYPVTLSILTYTRFEGEGFPPALPPSVILVVIGGVAAGVVMWLSVDRQRRVRQPVLEPGIRPTGGVRLPRVPTEPFDVDLDLRAGSFRLRAAFQAPPGITAILGPSGAGKSLTLRCIAGLEELGTGHVRLGATTLLDTAAGVDLPPEHRHLGYVAQRDALFQNLSVEENVAFGLWRLPKQERDRRVDALVDALGLEHLRHLGPQNLSGGERQRVALARTLATGPAALLLDEAFSALDATLRHQARRLVRDLHESTGIPVVLVTHDREDVLDLAGYVVVIGQGKVLQQGPTQEVFSRPATADVAQLVGITNLLQVRSLERLAGTAAVVVTDWAEIVAEAPDEADAQWRVAVPTDAVGLDLAGDSVWVSAARPALAGWAVEVSQDLGSDLLEVLLPRDEWPRVPAVGTRCEVVIDGSRCILVPPPVGAWGRERCTPEGAGPVSSVSG